MPAINLQSLQGEIMIICAGRSTWNPSLTRGDRHEARSLSCAIPMLNSSVPTRRRRNLSDTNWKEKKTLNEFDWNWLLGWFWWLNTSDQLIGACSPNERRLENLSTHARRPRHIHARYNARAHSQKMQIPSAACVRFCACAAHVDWRRACRANARRRCQLQDDRSDYICIIRWLRINCSVSY